MRAELNLRAIRPYADQFNDGLVQISFTLPVPYTLAARAAAAQLVAKMGIEKPDVVHYQELTPGYTYFVVFGSCTHAIDYAAIREQEHDLEFMDKEEVEAFVREKVRRKIVVIGASTGTDTHSVGIDAILNMKGYNGHSGLETYAGFVTHNLGSQVTNGALLARAIAEGADALLVSQTVTQRELHLHNLTQLVDMVEAQGLRKKVLLICGGPRITNELAKELGYDAGFSKGCYAEHVATFIARELAERARLEAISKSQPPLPRRPGSSATMRAVKLR